jgi:DNA-binding transcriptional ArsR family regulator
MHMDRYVVTTLMRDLVGHDRAASAFIVYLWLWTQIRGEQRDELGCSLQTIATATGLSKSSVQNAIRHLRRRHLLESRRDGPTSACFYRVLEPWRR